jgi:phosphatidylglycerol:prolipoprotein diacylglycerol transferase
VNEAYYHPTFLYESLWNLGVCAGLFWLSARYPKLKRGTIFLLYAIAYSLGRVWIEALRLDSLMVGPLKMAQVVSLGAIAIALLGLVWLYGLKRNLPDVRPVQIEK